MLLERFPKLWSEEDTQRLTKAVLNCPELKDENGIVEYYRNSHGITNLPETLDYVDKMTAILKQVYHKPIRFSNTYSRIYRKGSFLGIHTDRQGLDITMSVCIKKTAVQKWPLCVSLNPWEGPWNRDVDPEPWKDLYYAINLNEGDAAVMEGIIYPHWRDELVCDDDQHALYVFYHWTKE